MLPPATKILHYLFLVTAGTFGPASLREQGDVDGQDKEQWRVSKNQENSVCSSAPKPWADASVWRSLVFCRQWSQAGDIWLRGTQRLPELTLLCGQPRQVWGCKGYTTPVVAQRAELLYPGKDVACSSSAINTGDRWSSHRAWDPSLAAPCRHFSFLFPSPHLYFCGVEC